MPSSTPWPGAKPFVANRPHGTQHPAIYGIGEHLSFVDRYGERGSIYDVDFIFYPTGRPAWPRWTRGSMRIDHLTHNVHRGNMNLWSNFYERIGNFREIRYFDIEGKLTGLHSRAMTAPCGKIRIPINESADDKSQIEEYLRQYKGRDPAHRASPLPTSITPSARSEGRGTGFMPTPDTYYEKVDSRAGGSSGGSGGAERAAHPHRRLADEGRHPAADLHRTPSSVPCSSRSSSARATRALVRATSRHCSNPSRLDQIRRGVLDGSTREVNSAAQGQKTENRAMRNWISFPIGRGTHSRQAHADLPEQAIYERELGRSGFFGPGHPHAPQACPHRLGQLGGPLRHGRLT